MPCVFVIQNKVRSLFHQTRQWCPQCWQTATLLVTISSRRGGGRFPFRSASCDQITGRNSSLNGHIHQPISSHHAKLWRVARRSRTSSTRTSRLRQRGHFMQSTPFLLWICTHYTACTPLLQSLFRHFVLRALNVSKCDPSTPSGWVDGSAPKCGAGTSASGHGCTFLGVTRRSCPFIAARYSPAFLPNRALAAQKAVPKARPSGKSLLLY